MRAPTGIAAREISPDDAPRRELQRWSSQLLRSQLHLHEVHQLELATCVGVEQSRVSRWASDAETETLPTFALLALLRSEVPRLRALGLGLMGELAMEGRAIVAQLPHVASGDDDVDTLGSGAKEYGEAVSHFGSTLRTTDRSALLEARRQVRESIAAGVVMERRLTARVAELDVGRGGPRKAR
ncbi:MAG: hypothetical protein IT379_39520 [Deltaproteobacteria bacterium]|nr:hypothetical protein [Deltaproteobacteria bacterium]